MISIIIISFNEEEWIDRIVKNLEEIIAIPASAEIILADGGSDDQTLAFAARHKITIVHSPKGKAKQANAGAKAANGDVLFFIHADMMLATNTLAAIEQKIKVEKYDGGGFANIFDEDNDKIKRLGKILNFRLFDKREQSDKGIFYGDNGIFVRRAVFETLGGFKEILIMEDYDFSKKLSASYQTIKIYDPPITVSARRHQKAGFLKTRLQWIIIRKLYKWGVSPEMLAGWYRDVR